MTDQSGPGRRGDDSQRQKRQDDERQRRSAGNEGGQSGKNAGPVLPEGEKVGEWSEKESDKEE
jgi:hypothetical protein